jgi:RES domain-containing protein
MFSLWRLMKARFSANPLSGQGAFLNGGRWNSAGTSVVYCSSGVALAALEVLVHLADPASVRGFVLVRLDIDEGAAIEDVPALPLDWKNTPPGAVAQSIGDEWVRTRRSLLLRVPSAVVPYEFNYLMNPAHPHASSVQVALREPFAFDQRLLV